jgi:hypothetical protein
MRQDATDPKRRMRQPRATKSATNECQRADTPADADLADPDLAAVMTAWPDLPGPIRAAVVALVQAAKGRG